MSNEFISPIITQKITGQAKANLSQPIPEQSIKRRFFNIPSRKLLFFRKTQPLPTRHIVAQPIITQQPVFTTIPTLPAPTTYIVNNQKPVLSTRVEQNVISKSVKPRGCQRVMDKKI